MGSDYAMKPKANISKHLVYSLMAAVVSWNSAAMASETTGTEMLFDTGTLDGVEIGTALTYSHERSADENIPVRAIEGGKITVSLIEEGGTARTEVTLAEGKSQRKLQHFPADRGNPIFVTFLESSVTSVKFATKGSPFYIRNRFKDAFAGGGTVTTSKVAFDGAEIDATTVEYHPFKDDKNKEKLGAAFENLSVTFTLSDAVPGHFLSMTTKAEVDGQQYFIEAVRFLDASKIED